MRVLGIDPGLTRCGVGVIDTLPGRRVRLVHYGVVKSAPDEPIDTRLLVIARGIDAAIDEFSPDAMAVERVFAQHNLRTVMGTAQVSGLALYAAARRAIPVGMHTPSEVKAAITGHGAADKNQVATMVTRILALSVTPEPADAADALALAICHAWRRGITSSAAPVGADMTPAQRAWAAAEKSSRRSR